MMSTKMAEKPAPNGKHRHALRNAFLLSGAVAVAISAAVTLLNHSPAGQPPAFSPVAGVLLVIGGLLGFSAVSAVYMKRTDEHDLLANLWGLSVGYLFFACAVPIWWTLNHSGLAGPVNFWTLYVFSALISGVVWGWRRFR